MKYARWAAFAVLALALVGCASKGAGSQQDACGLAEVKASAPAGGNAQAQQQSLQSGQRASNQPVQTDPAKWTPATTWGGGAGAVRAENNWMEDRSQAGAPSSNMMLVQPATQEQAQTVGGVHPQLMSLDRQLKDANMRLSVALSSGNTAMADKEYALIADLNKAYAAASADTAKTVNIHYDFANAYITQGMSSSSTASGRPGSASTSDEGTSVTPTAAQLAERAGAPVPEAPEALNPDVPPAGVATPVVPE